MKGIELYGKDWKKVQQLVGTRTSAQSRSHAQKVLPKVPSSSSNPKLPSKASPRKSDDDSPISDKPMVDNSEDGNMNGQLVIKSAKKSEKRKYSEMQVDESKDIEQLSLNEDDTQVRSHKRRCTIDVSSMQDACDLMIEDDEVSLKLLRKLTTPQKPIKRQSFCYPLNDFTGFKLDFNSDIESVENDDFGHCEDEFGSMKGEKFL